MEVENEPQNETKQALAAPIFHWNMIVGERDIFSIRQNSQVCFKIYVQTHRIHGTNSMFSCIFMVDYFWDQLVGNIQSSNRNPMGLNPPKKPLQLYDSGNRDVLLTMHKFILADTYNFFFEEECYG